jgi:hypothetical protein
MFRRMGVVFASTLLVAAAGCSGGSFLLSSLSPGGKQQVVSGSVDQVSTHLQGALSNAGFLVAATKDGQDVRLAGVTKSGKRFTLFLKRRQTDAGESTVVSIDWAADADEPFWLTVLELLAAFNASR